MNINNVINLARYLFMKNPSIARKVVKLTGGAYTSTSPEVFCKNVVLRIFAKSAGKESLFKKMLRHRCFPVSFAKFLRTCFVKEHLQWLLLIIKSYQVQFIKTLSLLP